MSNKTGIKDKNNKNVDKISEHQKQIEQNEQQIDKIQKKESKPKEKKLISDASDSDFKDYNEDDTRLVHIFTTKFQTFRSNPSILDDQTPGSALTRSLFRGFHNIAIIFGSFTLLTYPLKRYKSTGVWFNDELLNTFSSDFFIVIISWPLFYLWTHTALIIQKLILYGLPIKFAKILQHLTQICMFVYTIYMVKSRNWCTTHSGFISMQACCHFIKMHTFTQMNYLFRADYLECKNNSSGDKKPLSIYPQNINLKNFTLFMWMPVMVYQCEYPRFPEKRRIGYIIRKCCMAMGAILCGYIVIVDCVMPAVQKGNSINVLELIVRICMPLCGFQILIFYIIFECIMNIFAEITRFGDRSFYKDYWNSTTFEEFNRKWNQPVYSFLFRHVYLECFYKYKLSKRASQLITFLFSAMLHEYVFSLVFKTITPIMSLFMLQQIPLFVITKKMQGKRSGSFLFWWGLMFGVPLIGSLYLRVDSTITNNYTKII